MARGRVPKVRLPEAAPRIAASVLVLVAAALGLAWCKPWVALLKNPVWPAW